MSRVRKPGNRFMNTNKHPPSVTGPSKMIRIKGSNADHTKASSLTDWLFLKYDMSYKTYRNRSRNRRQELRREYAEDTGADIRTQAEIDHDDMMGYLTECGVLFDDMREPFGI